MATVRLTMTQIQGIDKNNENEAIWHRSSMSFLLFREPTGAYGRPASIRTSEIKAMGEISQRSEGRDIQRATAPLCSQPNSQLSSFLSHADTDIMHTLAHAVPTNTFNPSPSLPPQRRLLSAAFERSLVKIMMEDDSVHTRRCHVLWMTS